MQPEDDNDLCGNCNVAHSQVKPCADGGSHVHSMLLHQMACEMATSDVEDASPFKWMAYEGCRIEPQTRSKKMKIPETSGINVLYSQCHDIVGVCRSFRIVFHGASWLRSYSTSFIRMAQKTQRTVATEVKSNAVLVTATRGRAPPIFVQRAARRDARFCYSVNAKAIKEKDIQCHEACMYDSDGAHMKWKKIRRRSLEWRLLCKSLYCSVMRLIII